MMAMVNSIQLFLSINFLLILIVLLDSYFVIRKQFTNRSIKKDRQRYFVSTPATPIWKRHCQSAETIVSSLVFLSTPEVTVASRQLEAVLKHTPREIEFWIAAKTVVWSQEREEQLSSGPSGCGDAFVHWVTRLFRFKSWLTIVRF